MKKGSEKEGRSRFVLVLSLLAVISLAFLLALLFRPPAVSAQTAGCCIDSNSVCSYSDSDSCAVPPNTGFYANTQCSDVPGCSSVCCEVPPPSQICGWMTQAACSAVGGNPNPAYQTENACANYCQGGAVVQGYVNYSDSVPALGAQVIFLVAANGIGLTPATADPAGFYSKPVDTNTVYTVTAHAPDPNSACASAEATIDTGTGAGTYTQSFVLPCSSPGSGCLTVWETGPWSNGNCGTRTVTDTGNCIPTTYSNKPVSEFPCVGASTCGNGVIEPPECEPSIPLTDTCATLYNQNYVGTVSCTSQCMLTDNCRACPADAGGCTEDVLCTCDVCQGVQPVCAPVCDATGKVNPFSAKGIYDYAAQKKGVEVSWSVPSACEVDTTDVYRCKADDANNPTKCKGIRTLIDTVQGSVTVYDDYPPQSSLETAYCYNISANINTGFDQFSIHPDGLACAPLWDDVCIQTNNPDGNGKVCDANGDLVTCTGGQAGAPTSCAPCGCIAATTADEAHCSEGCTWCDVCSGPFGLMPYINYNLQLPASGSEIYESCSDVLNALECYQDDYSRDKTQKASISIMGRDHACSGVASCYDYRAKVSCETNPCSIQAASSCRWMNLSDNDELGIGVCMPTDPALQDCSECSDLNILGDYCPKALCMLFGQDASGESTCYYNTVQAPAYEKLRADNTSCMNKEDVACETYDSEQECTGGTPFSADVIYAPGGNTLARTGTTNKPLALSGDALGRGKCVWLSAPENKCVRDADYNTPYGKTAAPGDGCVKSDPDGTACLTDFENPNTTLYVGSTPFIGGGVYSKAEIKMMTADSAEPLKETYVNMGVKLSGGGGSGSSGDGNEVQMPAGPGTNNPPGNQPPSSDYVFVYPKDPTDTLKNFRNGISSKPAGDYRLYYYSKDNSMNLEELKTLDFTLLPDLSGIIVNYTLSPAFYPEADMYLTNLTVYVNYDPAKIIICRMSLTSTFDPGFHSPQDATKSTPDLTWHYDYLPDGEYVIHTVCTDEHEQSYANDTVVEIDADISIHDPSPRGETFRAGEITISITTNATAACYYTTDSAAAIPPGETTPDEVYWTPFGTETPDGLGHSSDVNASAQGLYFYYPACNFNSTGTVPSWYMWNNGDIMYFAIDETPPTVLLYDAGTGEVYNSSVSAEQASILFICDDYSQNLEGGYRNYSFGCNPTMQIVKTYRDATTGGVLQTFPAVTVQSGDTQTYDAPPTYVKVYLNITSQDLGNPSNAGEQEEWINVRNLSFQQPEVTICNPLTGECN